MAHPASRKQIAGQRSSSSSSSSPAAAATTSHPPHLSSQPSAITTTSSSSSTSSSNKTRQYAHLHSQLAQLNAHLADTENLVRMTAVQAQDIRFLGGYVGALFMGSAKVLGEESLRQQQQQQQQADVGRGGGGGAEGGGGGNEGYTTMRSEG